MKRRYCRRAHPRAPYILLVIVIAAAGAYAAGRMSRGYVQPAHTSPTAAPESVQTETIVLDAYSFYAIQFGAFDNDADARALTESYVSRGAAGYVLTDTRSRAIGAAYENRSDADKVCANLTAQGIDTYVYTVSAPRVELRVKAEPSLISAIRAGHETSLNAISRLSQIALELDKGTLSVDDARGAVSAVGDTAEDARNNLETALNGRTHAATSGILSELSAARAACDAINQQSSQNTMAFSAKIKYNVIDLMQRHVQFMKMLIQPAASA